MAIIGESSATFLVALYVLTLSVLGFYIIYLGSQTEFVNNDNLQKEVMGQKLLYNLRKLRDASYNSSIFLVVINFFVILLLIFNKFKISLRV